MAGHAGGTDRPTEGDEESPEDDDEFNDEEDLPKKGRLRGVGGRLKGFASAIGTAAKEHIAGSILGDDFGEALVERMEERNEKKDDEEETAS